MSELKEQQQAEFEAWAVGDGPWMPHAMTKLSDGSYADDDVRDQWTEWQAARASAPAPQAAPSDAMREFIENIAKPYSEPLNSVSAYRDKESRIVKMNELRQQARAILAAAPAVAAPSEDAKDAARYRWLRNAARDQNVGPIVVMMDSCGQILSENFDNGIRSDDQLDKAVDAARAPKEFAPACSVCGSLDLKHEASGYSGVAYNCNACGKPTFVPGEDIAALATATNQAKT